MKVVTIVVALASSTCASLLPQQRSSTSRVELISDDFEANGPVCSDAAPVLAYLVKFGNRFLDSSRILTDKTVELFGIEDNHIDPMDFNGRVTAKSSGSACSEEKCFRAFGKRVCVPRACTAGLAEASLDKLYGLSTMRMVNTTCVDVAETEPGRLTAHGEISLHSEALHSEAHAKARASLLGRSVTVSSSGLVTVNDVVPRGRLSLQLSYKTNAVGRRVYQIEEVVLSELLINHGSIDVSINKLSLFDSMFSALVQAVQGLVERHFDIEGAISVAVAATLNDVAGSVLPAVNRVLRDMAF